MNKLIYTYALIRALYDQGDDYLDSFLPFAVQALNTSKFIDIPQIQKNVEQNTGISIPLHVMGTILKRGKRRGFLEYQLEVAPNIKRQMYKLTTKGANYLRKLERGCTKTYQ